MKDNCGTTGGAEFDKDVYDALEAAGWMFPETPDGVEQAEKELGQGTIELPDRLSNASGVFDDIRQSPAEESEGRTIQFPRDENIARSLARAARDGGDISEELADRMRQDRQRAQEQDDGQ